jgi:type II secretory pathway component GspD/PulD (secretin)
LNRVISVVQQITRGSAQIVSDPVLHTIAITGTPEGVTNAEQLLRRFDTPAAEAKQHQTQLVMYLVEASDQATSDQRIRLISAVQSSS